MRTLWSLTILTGLLLLGGAARARGAVPTEPVDVAFDGAQRVVRARAVAESSFTLRGKSKTAPREVRTEWRLAVMESWKGPMERGRPLTLRVRGGQVGDFTSRVEGEPAIMRGGEYLFFLKLDSLATVPGREVWRTSSAAWGCLPIERNMVDWPQVGGSKVAVTVGRLRREVEFLKRRRPAAADSTRRAP
jgi:hypothetical protein